MAGLKPGSLVINATGLGKDAPGSPLTDAARWPEDGIAWDFNYRGDLVFLRQARAQQQARQLQIEDGWIYFIHGWTRVIAEVFHIDIPDQRAAIRRAVADRRRAHDYRRADCTDARRKRATTSLMRALRPAVRPGRGPHARSARAHRAPGVRHARLLRRRRRVGAPDRRPARPARTTRRSSRPVPEEYGQVKFCISKLYPGTVGDECFMTKGHYHAVLETGEVYLCLRGRGLMMMKTADGQCRWEEFAPGPAGLRAAVLGASLDQHGRRAADFAVPVPGDAGHNYGDIRTEGFPKRVFRREGRVAMV